MVAEPRAPSTDHLSRRRLRARRAVMIATVVLAIAAVPLTLAAVALVHDRRAGVDEESYVARNADVLAQIPVFPGARCSSQTVSWGIGRRDRWWPFGEATPHSFYITERACRLPAAASSQQVVSFYRGRLEPTWTFSGPKATAGFPPPCDAAFRRGEALLLVLACNRTLAVRVDHAAYR